MMTPRKRVRAALACEPTDQVPWVELGNKGPVVEMLLDYPLPIDLENASSSNQDHVEVYVRSLVEFSQKTGLDAVLLKFWSPVFEDTQSVVGGQTIGRSGLIQDAASLETCRKQMTQPIAVGSPEYESAKTYQHVMDENDLARGFQIGSIYGFAECSMGYESMCMGFYDTPDLIKAVVQLGADHVIETARRLCDLVDLDFIVLNDDIAFKTGPLISPDLFREFFLEHFVRLGQVLAEKNVAYVMHTDGNFVPLLEMILEAGVVAIQPFEPAAVNISKIKKQYGKRLCPMGNVDVDMLIRGTPQQVYEQTKQLLLTVGCKDGYILSSGNIIMEQTPRDNVMAMIQAHRDFARADQTTTSLHGKTGS